MIQNWKYWHGALYAPNIFISVTVKKHYFQTDKNIALGHLKRKKKLLGKSKMPRCHTFCCLLCNSCLIFIIIIFLFALFTQYKKNLFTVVIARRQGDPESHWAYGRATSLTLINKVKKKCCECAARPIQGLFK